MRADLMRRYYLPVLLLTVAFLLTACREQSDYYFYDDGSWRFKDMLTIDKALIDLGLSIGSQAFGEEFGIEIPDSALDSGNWIELAYSMMTNELNRQGYKAHWANRGKTYIIQVEGHNHAQFRSLGRNSVVLEILDNGSYHLSINVSGLMTQFDIPEFSEPGGLFTYEREVTLHTRKIISSNADEVHGGIATWRGMKNVEAVFLPLSPFSASGLVYAAGGLLVMVVVISIAVSLARRGSLCPECGKRLRKGQEICPHCGAYAASYGTPDTPWDV